MSSNARHVRLNEIVDVAKREDRPLTDEELAQILADVAVLYTTDAYGLVNLLVYQLRQERGAKSPGPEPVHYRFKLSPHVEDIRLCACDPSALTAAESIIYKPVSKGAPIILFCPACVEIARAEGIPSA